MQQLAVTPMIQTMSVTEWVIERRDDGSLIVRIPSKPYKGQPLPDAVFSFREGDPQYRLWEERYEIQEQQATLATGKVGSHEMNGSHKGNPSSPTESQNRRINGHRG